MRETLRLVSVLCLLLRFLALPAVAAEHAESAPAATPAQAPLFDNLGDHHHPITTRSKLAQRYFDQGLRLVYAFNHDEAARSFGEAARLDPDCAMAYWGIALARGPNINLPMDQAAEREAFAAAQKALALRPHASEAERAYIEALAGRYALDEGADRRALQVTYADAMREVVRRHPRDDDAATLFAEALMDLHPWDLWKKDGEPQPGTLEILTTLEAVLRRNPDHPGANHYYIHAVEASPHPERGLASAERLGRLMPGAGHIVHMPSHIYARVGRYDEAAAVNARAIAVDRNYIEAFKVGGFYAMMYYPHNIHFRWSVLLAEGRSADALGAADDLARVVPSATLREMPPFEMIAPTRLFTLVRFARWNEVLSEPAPPPDFELATAMWHYGRGLAFCGTDRLGEASGEASQLASLTAQIPADRGAMNNTAGPLLAIATSLLDARIADKRGDREVAIRRLEQAVETQDGLGYNEPPDWYYPVRQSLGAELLAAGRPVEAEAVYRADLQRNPENGWSLFGLAESLRASGDAAKVDESRAVEARLRRAWARADVKPGAIRP
jgi:tetratricopeptide (TPR) repeat protein